MFNAEKFLKEYGIATSKKATNWIQICCPFCHEDGYHGGFNLKENYYHCWKCKWHSLQDVISKLTGTTYPENIDILNKYEDGQKHISTKSTTKRNTNILKVKLPHIVKDFPLSHKKYLLSRGFKNPQKIIDKWKLEATGHLGAYNWRILAPIYFDKEMVSYQARDITKKSKLKYKACKLENEIVHHQHILYGLDKVPGDTVVVVEGIFDVWKLGFGAVATFGISYTQQQVLLLSDRFKKVFIFYDGEPRAQIQATKLAKDLIGLGIKCVLLLPEEGDPGDMTEKQGKQLMEGLLCS